MDNRQLILNKCVEILFERHEMLNFRKIAQELDISTSTINYQFKGKDNLYLSVIKHYVQQMISVETSFDQFILQASDVMIFMMDHIDDDVKLSFINNIPSILWTDMIDIIESLYIKQYGQVDRQALITIITSVQMLGISYKPLSEYLGINLVERALRHDYITNSIIKSNIDRP